MHTTAQNLLFTGGKGILIILHIGVLPIDHYWLLDIFFYPLLFYVYPFYLLIIYQGHPLCNFCDKRYVDGDELFRHLRRDHYFCHYCDADGMLMICNYYGSWNIISCFIYLQDSINSIGKKKIFVRFLLKDKTLSHYWRLIFKMHSIFLIFF